MGGEFDLGRMNCKGSYHCRHASTFNTVSIERLIHHAKEHLTVENAPDPVFAPDQHAICMPDPYPALHQFGGYCTFVQKGASPVKLSTVLLGLQGLSWAKECKTCGSIDLGEVQRIQAAMRRQKVEGEPWKGILTVNYVRDVRGCLKVCAPEEKKEA